MQESGLGDLISALSHLPSMALGLGPGAKVHTASSSASSEQPTSMFIKPFLKRFFLNISAGAWGFFHPYLLGPRLQHKELRERRKHHGPRKNRGFPH